MMNIYPNSRDNKDIAHVRNDIYAWADPSTFTDVTPQNYTGQIYFIYVAYEKD